MEGQGINHWFSFKNACIYVNESDSNSPFLNDGSSIFFLHGRFGRAAVWSPLVNGLSSQYRCYSIDLPGFGHSFFTQEIPFSLLDYVQLINEVIFKLTRASEKVVLVGHDVGGGVAQICALRQPYKISSLILMNSTSPICPLVKLRTSFQGWFVFRKLLELLNLSEKIRREDQLMLIGPWEDKLGKVSLTATIHTIHSSWPQHYEREVWRNAIEDLVQPVLLLWGKNDPLNPGDVAVELLNKLPDATYFLHEECGHWPNLEQTDWVLGKMKEFIFRNRLRESA